MGDRILKVNGRSQVSSSAWKFMLRKISEMLLLGHRVSHHW